MQRLQLEPHLPEPCARPASRPVPGSLQRPGLFALGRLVRLWRSRPVAADADGAAGAQSP
ncbi:hypothetical protein P7K49_027899, partial [Saguinus oedipus]